MQISARALAIEPFYVLEVAKAAAQLAQTLAHTDAPMVFLNIGEPDFTAPPLVQQAATQALQDGLTQYTPALGLMPLRERIADWYATRFGVQVPASRIVITAGASAALHLACMALINPGDAVLMPDPSYPCNRHFVSAAGGQAVLLPTTAAERFQLSADQVQSAWGPRTRGVRGRAAAHLKYIWTVMASKGPSPVIWSTSSPSQPAPAPGLMATRLPAGGRAGRADPCVAAHVRCTFFEQRRSADAHAPHGLWSDPPVEPPVAART